MSSGMVSTNIGRRPDRVKSGKGVSVNLSPFFAGRRKFSVNDYVWANPVTSYRSGPAYDREARKPGAVLGNTYVSEVMAAAAGDLGHEFSMRRVTDFFGSTWARRPDPTFNLFYSQLTNPIPVFPISSGGGISYQNFVDKNYGFVKSRSDLETLGTSFINSTNPIQSQVNLLSTIAEIISDGSLLPELLGKQIVSSVIRPSSRRDLIRSTGSEYLNYIFGYKPLADDIAKVGVLIDTVNLYIDQWIRDNGTIVRRRRKLPGEPNVTDSRSFTYNHTSANSSQTFYAFSPSSNPTMRDPDVSGVAVSVPVPYQSQVESTGLWVTRVSSEINFSAGFKYDFSRLATPVEGGGSAADLMHDAALRNELGRIVFGLDTASIGTALYDATPFSWLLDWFANIGEIIDNFRGLQSRGVRMLWGYISETAVRDFYFEYKSTLKSTGETFVRSNGISAQKAITRVRATPFGFGTRFDSLTTSQSATLAALGASKIR